MALKYGMLLDLIAIEQIKSEGADLKASDEEKTEEFMRLLNYK